MAGLTVMMISHQNLFFLIVNFKNFRLLNSVNEKASERSIQAVESTQLIETAFLKDSVKT